MRLTALDGRKPKPITHRIALHGPWGVALKGPFVWPNLRLMVSKLLNLTHFHAVEGIDDLTNGSIKLPSLSYVLHVSHYMHWHAMVCFSTRMSEGLLWRKTTCQVVMWSGFVWRFFSQGATCNIMSSEFSLCQVAGVNARATVHFWDWYVLVKKILPQLPEILPQLTQGKWFVLGTWFLTQTATRLNTFQSCWNIFTSDQKCLSAYEVYEALIFKYQDSQLPNGRLPVAKRCSYIWFDIYMYIHIVYLWFLQGARSKWAWKN